MSWQFGDRRPWPFEVISDVLVSHACPLFGGITVVSEAPHSEKRDGAGPVIVPLCGCYAPEASR